MTDIAKKYRKLSDIEHVLHRPTRHIGSIKSAAHNVNLLLDSKIKTYNVSYNPGFLKIFDEIISNSVDEHKRNPKLNKIDVTVDKATGIITVRDNGGIPVVQHPEWDEYIPQFVFTNLRAGSNFNDEEDQRTGAGTHGEGATLTNIFSKQFIIETADGKKKYYQEFKDNLQVIGKPKITASKDGYTQITYLPDYARFKMSGICDADYHMIRKRVLDIAACNKGLVLTFNDEKFSFTSFKDYLSLYTDQHLVYEESKHWKFAVGPSSVGFKTVAFVNSVETRDGGTHVDYIINQITDWLRKMILKKHKLDLKPGEIRKSITLYLDATIFNNEFSSQTKEKLVTDQKDFGTYHQVSDAFMKKVFQSEVVKGILDWIDKKQMAEEKAMLRKANKNISKKKVIKLIDAKKKGDRSSCILGIFEGDSAKNGVEAVRDVQTFGAFPIRGKFRNVRELTNAQVVKNEEVQQLMASIGLKLGEPPTNLRFGKIYIYSDADPDGDGIGGLLINFFAKYWPELFDRGKIYKIMTPLQVAKKKGTEDIYFYTREEFEEWEKKMGAKAKQWNVEYKKGLGSLEDDEYDPIINNPRAVKITRDNQSRTSLDAWFGGDSDERKERILELQKI